MFWPEKKVNRDGSLFQIRKHATQATSRNGAGGGGSGPVQTMTAKTRVDGACSNVDAQTWLDPTATARSSSAAWVPEWLGLNSGASVEADADVMHQIVRRLQRNVSIGMVGRSLSMPGTLRWRSTKTKLPGKFVTFSFESSIADRVGMQERWTPTLDDPRSAIRKTLCTYVYRVTYWCDCTVTLPSSWARP